MPTTPNLVNQVVRVGSDVSVNAYVHLEVRIPKREIWLFKLKCVWAVIRAKTNVFNSDEQAA